MTRGSSCQADGRAVVCTEQMARTTITITVTTRKRDLTPARGWLVYAS